MLRRKASKNHQSQAVGTHSLPDEMTDSMVDTHEMTRNTVDMVSGKTGRKGRIVATILVHRWLSAVIVLCIVLAIVMAVPLTRYKLLGLAIKKTVTVTVLDSTSHLPVSHAEIMLAGRSVQTDDNGVASLTVPVGIKSLTVSRRYYKAYTQSVLVNLASTKNNLNISLIATGRQVPVTVQNAITGKPLAGAVIRAQDSTTKTDKDGKTYIVLPTAQPKYDATISLDGYNTAKTSIVVTTHVISDNQLKLTPQGRVYLLSNANSTVDIVSVNLDGSDRKTALVGTGKEDRNNVQMAATKDWHYIALLARREGDNPKLYLFDTTSNKLSVVDEGSAGFDMKGWVGHSLVYVVSRSNYQMWQPKAFALKTFDADKTKLTLIDESQAEGDNYYNYARSNFSVASADGLIVYGISWTTNGYYSGWGVLATARQASLVTVKPDGSDRRVVKTFDVPKVSGWYSVDLYDSKPGVPYVTYTESGKVTVYQYHAGSLTTSTIDVQQLYNRRVSYILSPNGQRTVWYEDRDGKTAVFVGDVAGNNGKQVATLSEQYVYGWANDNYILVFKNASELYVMSAEGGQPVKVTDFLTPGLYATYVQ